MPKLKTVEKQIERVERFRVRFKDRKSGKDVNGNLEGIPSYPYNKMARNISSFIKWKSERFKKVYLGYEVDVLNENRHVAHGRTHLGTVHDTYLD